MAEISNFKKVIKSAIDGFNAIQTKLTDFNASSESDATGLNYSDDRVGSLSTNNSVVSGAITPTAMVAAINKLAVIRLSSGSYATGKIATYTGSSVSITAASGTTISVGGKYAENNITVTLSDASKIISGNIKSGVTILGVTGSSKVLDTSDATAVASEIISGKTAYVNGSKITGQMTTVTPLFDGGALSLTASSTNVEGTNVTLSGTNDSGISLTTSGSTKVVRGNVLYNGAVSGFVSKADDTVALDGTTTSAMTLGGATTKYISGLTLGTGKTLASLTNNGTITTMGGAGTVSNLGASGAAATLTIADNTYGTVNIWGTGGDKQVQVVNHTTKVDGTTVTNSSGDLITTTPSYSGGAVTSNAALANAQTNATLGTTNNSGIAITATSSGSRTAVTYTNTAGWLAAHSSATTASDGVNATTTNSATKYLDALVLGSSAQTTARTLSSLTIQGASSYKSTLTSLENNENGIITTYSGAGTIGTYTNTGTINLMTGERTITNLGNSGASGTLNVNISNGIVNVNGGNTDKGVRVSGHTATVDGTTVTNSSGDLITAGTPTMGDLSLTGTLKPTVSIAEVADTDTNKNIDLDKVAVLASKDTTNYPYYFRVKGTTASTSGTIQTGAVTSGTAGWQAGNATIIAAGAKTLDISVPASDAKYAFIGLKAATLSRGSQTSSDTISLDPSYGLSNTDSGTYSVVNIYGGTSGATTYASEADIPSGTYAYFIKLDRGSASSNKTITSGAVTLTEGYTTGDTSLTGVSSTVTGSVASASKYIGVKKATGSISKVSGTGSVSVTSQNITTSETANGIYVKSVGSGSVNVSASTGSSGAGYLGNSTQFVGSTAVSSGNSSDKYTYITGVTVPEDKSFAVTMTANTEDSLDSTNVLTITNAKDRQINITNNTARSTISINGGNTDKGVLINGANGKTVTVDGTTVTGATGDLTTTTLTLNAPSSTLTAEATAAPGNVTISNTASVEVSGKTQLTATPTTDTANISTYYMAIKANAAANSTGTAGSETTHSNVISASTGTGWITASSPTGNVKVKATAKTSSKDSSQYYIPIASGVGAANSASATITSGNDIPYTSGTPGTAGSTTVSLETSTPTSGTYYTLTANGSGSSKVSTAGWIPKDTVLPTASTTKPYYLRKSVYGSAVANTGTATVSLNPGYQITIPAGYFPTDRVIRATIADASSESTAASNYSLAVSSIAGSSKLTVGSLTTTDDTSNYPTGNYYPITANNLSVTATLTAGTAGWFSTGSATDSDTDGVSVGKLPEAIVTVSGGGLNAGATTITPTGVTLVDSDPGSTISIAAYGTVTRDNVTDTWTAGYLPARSSTNRISSGNSKNSTTKTQYLKSLTLAAGKTLGSNTSGSAYDGILIQGSSGSIGKLFAGFDAAYGELYIRNNGSDSYKKVANNGALITATPAFTGGDVTATISTNEISASNLTYNTTNTSGISFSASASGSYTRDAVTYNGAVDGWVNKSSGAEALAAKGSTTITAKGTGTKYLTGITIPSGKTLASVVVTGTLTKLSGAGTVTTIEGQTSTAYTTITNVTNNVRISNVGISGTAGLLDITAVTNGSVNINGGAGTTTGGVTISGNAVSVSSGNSTSASSVTVTNASGFLTLGSATVSGATLASTSTSLSGTTLTVQATVNPTVSAGWVSAAGSGGTIKITGTVPTETKAANGAGDVTPTSGNLLSKVTVAAAVQGTSTVSGTGALKPTIAKNSNTNVSTGSITTTKPGSGYYVAVASDADTTGKTVSITPTISTAGWIAAGNMTAGSGKVTLSASDTTYLPITSGSYSVAYKTASGYTSASTNFSPSISNDSNNHSVITFGSAVTTKPSSGYYFGSTVAAGTAKKIAATATVVEGYIAADTADTADISIGMDSAKLYIPYTINSGDYSAGWNTGANKSWTPSISKNTTNTNVSSGDATTTKPGSGYYVAIQSTNTGSQTYQAKATIGTAGYIGTGSKNSSTSYTAQLNQSSVTYVPITSGSIEITSNNLTVSQASAGSVAISTDTISNYGNFNSYMETANSQSSDDYYKLVFSSTNGAASGSSAVTVKTNKGYVPDNNTAINGAITNTSSNTSITVNNPGDRYIRKFTKTKQDAALSVSATATATQTGSNVSFGETDSGITVTATGTANSSASFTPSTTNYGYIPSGNSASTKNATEAQHVETKNINSITVAANKTLTTVTNNGTIATLTGSSGAITNMTGSQTIGTLGSSTANGTLTITTNGYNSSYKGTVAITTNTNGTVTVWNAGNDKGVSVVGHTVKVDGTTVTNSSGDLTTTSLTKGAGSVSLTAGATTITSSYLTTTNTGYAVEAYGTVTGTGSGTVSVGTGWITSGSQTSNTSDTATKNSTTATKYVIAGVAKNGYVTTAGWIPKDTSVYTLTYDSTEECVDFIFNN